MSGDLHPPEAVQFRPVSREELYRVGSSLLNFVLATRLELASRQLGASISPVEAYEEFERFYEEAQAVLSDLLPSHATTDLDHRK